MIFVGAILGAVGQGQAGELRHGQYSVAIEITLPNVNTSDYSDESEICWKGPGDVDMPLGPLGRGPLKNCPANAEWVDGEIHVHTTCPGPNAGFAVSVYKIVPGGFRGTSDLNMGGKNMRVGERQHGRYLGPC